MNAGPPVRDPAASFATVGGSLAVGGIALPRLAERVGATPFFAYDRELISRRIAALRQALPPQVELHYALKANPMPAVVQHLAGLVDGFDVASADEMLVALDTGMPADEVSFAGPGKTDGEIAQAVAAGITLNLESETEMERVADAAARLGVVAAVAIRVNPDFELKSSGMRMGGGPKQFGIDAEQVPRMLGRLASLGLRFKGFHVFSGSQNLSAEAIIEAQAKTLALAARLVKHAPAPMATLNIGGGFGIPYFPGDVPLELVPIGAALGTALEAFRVQHPETRIVIELGRYLVGEAGVYVCRVVDRKVSRGEVFLVTDGGLHHQLAASGNFGQVIRRNYPLAIGNRMDETARERATVVGCLCTPLDLLGDKVELAPAQAGDLVVIFQSGAYGASASPQAFLSHPPAREVLV